MELSILIKNIPKSLLFQSTQVLKLYYTNCEAQAMQADCIAAIQTASDPLDDLS